MTGAFFHILLQETSCSHETHEQEVRSAIQGRIRAAFESIHVSYGARAVLHHLLISLAYGQLHAVSIEGIQGNYPSLTDRAIKAAVKELIEVRGVPIGSSRGHGSNGYYFIVSAEDAAAAIGPLLSEIRSLAHRVHVLSPSTDLGRLLNGQRSLEAVSDGN